MSDPASTQKLPPEGFGFGPDGELYPDEYKVPYIEYAPGSETKIWINGVTLDIAPGFLSAYFDDLRFDHQEGFVIPGWGDECTDNYIWGHYVWFAPSDEAGFSAFTQVYLRSLMRFKVALFESANMAVLAMAKWPRYGPHMATLSPDEKVRQMAKFSPEDFPESSADYKSQFKAAVAHVRKAAVALDALMKAAEDSGSPITCWGQPDCKIVEVYAGLNPAALQPLIDLPHLRREISDAEAGRGALVRLVNCREAEFNKWVKLKLREINAQPE